VAVQTFVQDSFGGEKAKEGVAGAGLDSFEFSGKKVILVKGRYTFMAVAIAGTEPNILREEMVNVLERVEGMYAGVVEQWQGDMDVFSGVETYILPIMYLKSCLTTTKKKTFVKLGSALEFYQGFIRLKVATINQTDATITDALLRLNFNKQSLTLTKIEPDYPHEGSEVDLGVVKPQEKKTVAFYLDPMICQESWIDGTLSFNDVTGELHHVDMKRKNVDIVCPIFYTPATINTAMLKRLTSELSYKDSRVFDLKTNEKPKLVQAFDIAKNATRAHDVKFVREYIEDDPQPYTAEAWFYGKTSETEEELVIRVTVRSVPSPMVELYVATSNLASMTGLLAELGNKMRTDLVEGLNEPIQVLTDERTRNALSSIMSLLDKLDEGDEGGAGAAAPGSDVPPPAQNTGLRPVPKPKPAPVEPEKQDTMDSVVDDILNEIK